MKISHHCAGQVWRSSAEHHPQASCHHQQVLPADRDVLPRLLPALEAAQSVSGEGVEGGGCLFGPELRENAVILHYMLYFIEKKIIQKAFTRNCDTTGTPFFNCGLLVWNELHFFIHVILNVLCNRHASESVIPKVALFLFSPQQEAQKIFKAKNAMDSEVLKAKVASMCSSSSMHADSFVSGGVSLKNVTLCRCP